ncbi:MAG: MBL fold metallo-hydrolase [Deltaproteobacteria bacterium]|nr:MBL fold metallo-hydrolase [Deltaproteobacteria bacterium]
MSTSRWIATALFATAATAAAAASAAPAAAAPLTTTVYTGSADGFYVTSTLVAGEKDAILIDGQFDLADAHRLVATILESKKRLTTIYVTHFHPDHYFGLAVVMQAFPKATLVALPAAVAEIKASYKAKLGYWGPIYGANLTTKPPIPTALKGASLTLEGQTLEIHAARGDAEHNSYVWIPSTKTVIAGDIVYHGVHPWTAESDAAARAGWRASLDELAKLGPTTVVPGHREPRTKDDASGIAQTRAYLAAFDAAVAGTASSAEAQKKVKAAFPDLQLDLILQIGADAAFAPKPAAKPAK